MSTEGVGPVSAGRRRRRRPAQDLSPRPSVLTVGAQHDEIVAVDDLLAVGVAEGGSDALRVQALDLLDLGGAVVGQTAGDALAVRGEHRNRIAPAEATDDAAHAGRQEAAPVMADGGGRAAVDLHGGAAGERGEDPALAGLAARDRRAEARANRLA